MFVDEVHRFNRAQQDAFLPHVEAGNILLIGATTENPSFEVIAPLLSRMKVYVLHALSKEQIVALLRRALEDPERGLGKEHVEASGEILERIAVLANGDARSAYNTLEALVLGTEPGADGRRVLSEAAPRRRAAEKTAALRQERRRALQPDFRAAQIGAQFRPRCGALLAGAHARIGRRPAVPRAADGAHGQRRYRPGRTGRAGA